MKYNNVQAHRTMFDTFSVTYYVLQVPNKTELEEQHWVDALLAAFKVMPLGEGIDETQVDGTLLSVYKIVLGHSFAELEAREQFLLAVLFPYIPIGTITFPIGNDHHSLFP